MATSLPDLLPLLVRLNHSRDRATPLADLARDFHQSPTHFQRTFTRLVGESPKRLDLRLRLELAAARLLSTERSVIDIALAVGFASHEGFTRAFGRHFGLTPKRFRNEHQLSDGARERHVELLTALGPCVRLYRVPIANRSPGQTTMSYDITRQTIEPATVLYQRRRVEHAKIAETLGQILPHVFTYATKAQIPLAGPPLCRYRDWGPALVTLEAGIPVAEGAAAGDGVEVGQLWAGEAAVTIHTGPYDTLTDAYTAVDKWLAANGLLPADALWESYLTDPGEVPDPAEWKTQIFWPCKPDGA